MLTSCLRILIGGTLSLLTALPITTLIQAAPTPASPWPLNDKTLVAWVAPANLTQRGGSVLTIEKPGGGLRRHRLRRTRPGHLDGRQRWLPPHPTEQGISPGKRPPKRSSRSPSSTTTEITIYRNDQPTAYYTAEDAESFAGDSLVLMGLRHLDANADNRFFTGSIDDARIYAGA